MLRTNEFGLESIVEGMTGTLEFYFVDENGDKIAKTDIDTLVLTLYDPESGAVINNRNSQNVLDQNNGALDADGNFSWEIQPADVTITDVNIIHRQKPTYGTISQTYVAKFEWTYSGGLKKGIAEIMIEIEKVFTPEPS